MKTPYDAELKAWKKKRIAMIRLSLKDVPKAEIARKYGVSRQRVSKIVSDYHEKVKDGRISPL